MTKLITENIRSLDTLDDRREIWHLLHRLRPVERFRFLDWCSLHVYLPNSRIHPRASWFRMTPRVKAAQRGDVQQDEALTTEIYTDLWMLVHQYALPQTHVATSLEVAIRKGLRALPPARILRQPVGPGSSSRP